MSVIERSLCRDVREGLGAALSQPGVAKGAQAGEVLVKPLRELTVPSSWLSYSGGISASTHLHISSSGMW